MARIGNPQSYPLKKSKATGKVKVSAHKRRKKGASAGAKKTVSVEAHRRRTPDGSRTYGAKPAHLRKPRKARKKTTTKRKATTKRRTRKK